MSTQPTERDIRLRALLVDRVEAPAPRRRALFVVTVAVVALLSGATGASAAALTLAPSAQTSAADSRLAESLVLSVARPNAVLAGEVLSVSGKTGTAELGSRPDDATGIAIAVVCVAIGEYKVGLDGSPTMGGTCTSESSGRGGGVLPVDDGSSHALDLDGDAEVQLWAAWVREPPKPTASEQQLAEIEDGVITRDEYVAAFNRYSGCMGAAGVDVRAADPDAVIFHYSIPDAAVSSGTDELCYNTQFMQVDMGWQIQNSASSDTARVLGACLAAAGIAPASTTEEMLAQLEAAGIDPGSCP